MRKRILYSLLCIFVLAGLTACGSEEGVKVNSASALAKKLASDSAVKINISKDIVLDEPIVVRGEKELVGNGKIIAAVKDSEELYMLTVADGGKLTVGGSVKIDAGGLIGGIYVQSGGQAAVKDKAVVKNATEETANILVEGSFEVAGGSLESAKGHNLYNKKETVISGGEIIGSGEKYAGIYNEGTLTQTGGEISKAYNNISNVKGSTFTFEGGTNKTSTKDGVFVAEGASMKATKKEAVIENAGGRGILLQGQADIKVITVKDCGDTLIKVEENGVLNFENGILQEGNYHGVDNAGTMNMIGGTIQMNANCGIVNTGTLKVTSGSISNNANKGILNKHEGTADVTSAMVTFTSNKIAIANEDKAKFEFSKAKVLMSTQTNIYCYDGTVNLHDAVLNASTSNNVRIVDGTITMKNVEVNGNSQKSNTSHHGIYMEGGSINAENVTVSMTTGHGIRNKGGVFRGKNIVMHDINRVAVSQGKHDYLDVEGLTEINGLEVQSTNYSNIWNEGGGTVKITNAKLAVASSNSVRVNEGLVELTNVTIPGHKEGLKNNIHGIYMAGGKLVGKKISIANTTGSAVRSVKGMASLTDLKINNIGAYAFNVGNDGNVEAANVTITKTKSAAMLINGNGNLKAAHLTTSQINGQNILVEKNGKADISNAVLCKVEKAHNVKAADNGLVKLDTVKVLGTAAEDKYGLITEKGGDAILNNVEISDVQKHAAIRINHADSRIDGSGVTISNCQNGLTGSNGKVVIDGMKISDIQVMAVYSEGANITVSDLKTENITEGNVRADRKESARVVIKGAELCQTKTGHNVKAGMGLITLKDVEIKGLDSNAPGDKRAIIAEGGSFNLMNVQIHDVPKSGAIHVNKAASKVTGKDVTIINCANGLTGSNGKVEIDRIQIQNVKAMAVSSTGADVTLKHFTTESVKEGNVRADVGESAKVTIENAALCQTETGHNVKAGKGMIILKNVEIKGLDSNAPGDKRAIIAEGGSVNLTNVQIHDVPKSGAIHVNKEASKVTGEDVTITKVKNGITGSNGKVDIKGLTVHANTQNVLASGSVNMQFTDAEFGKTASHNVDVTGGILTLNHAKVLGTTAVSGTVNGIRLTGASTSVNATDVTVQETLSAAIRVSDGTFHGTKVTVQNIANSSGVQVSSGIVDVDGFTATGIANYAISTYGSGAVTVKNGAVTGGKRAINNANASRPVTVENFETTGQSEYGIYNTGTLKIAGVIKTNIYNDKAVTVEATKDLAGSDITIDWAAGKEPKDMVAIRFANAKDLEKTKASVDLKETVLNLGEIQSSKYQAGYAESEWVLNGAKEVPYKVTNYAELKNVLDTIKKENKTTATIIIAGDIVVPETIRIESGREIVLVSDETARVIKRAETFKADARLFYVESNAALTIKCITPDNERVMLTVDGGNISCTGNSQLVYTNGTLVVSEGVKLTGNNCTGDISGVGIYGAAGSTTTFKGILSNMQETKKTNSFNRGNAITVTGANASMLIQNAIISDNKMNNTAGVIWSTAGARLTMTDSVFRGNSSINSQGGVLRTDANSGVIEITRCKFDGNEALKSNGGVMDINTTGSDVLVTDCTFTNNKAKLGGAITLANNARLKLVDCGFSKNTATDGAKGNDIRVGGAGSKLYLSGKITAEIFNDRASRIYVDGNLTEGSIVKVDWNNSYATNNMVAINFSNESVLNESKAYIELGPIQKAVRKLNFNKTQAVLATK